MIVMATGTGKTATALALVVDFLKEGKRVAWLAHREEPLTQPRDAVAEFWPDLLASFPLPAMVKNACFGPIQDFLKQEMQMT